MSFTFNIGPVETTIGGFHSMNSLGVGLNLEFTRDPNELNIYLQPVIPWTLYIEVAKK